MNTNKEEKRKRINYIGVGVSDEAQRVFNAIVKTYDFFKIALEK